jgi:hypothetical protein
LQISFERRSRRASPLHDNSILQLAILIALLFVRGLRHLHPRLNRPPGEPVELRRYELLAGRRELPADVAEAATALRYGPGIAGEPTVFGGRRPGEKEIFSPVDGQRFVDVAAGIDEGALRPLSREGEYLGLVGQLEVAAAAGEHAAIAQVGQLRA